MAANNSNWTFAMNNEYTFREMDILRREYPIRTTEELSRMLGRSKQAIFVKASKMGLKKDHYGIVWTPQMLKMLRDFFPIMFNKPLAAWIGVSIRSLIRKARELGLEKRPGFLDDRREDITDLARTSLKKAYREGRLKSTFKTGERNNPSGEFKPGHVESPEMKAKRSASLKAAWKRRNQQAQFRKDYNINNN